MLPSRFDILRSENKRHTRTGIKIIPTCRLIGMGEITFKTVPVFTYEMASVYVANGMGEICLPEVLSGTPIRHSSLPADSALHTTLDSAVVLPASTTTSS